MMYDDFSHFDPLVPLLRSSDILRTPWPSTLTTFRRGTGSWRAIIKKLPRVSYIFDVPANSSSEAQRIVMTHCRGFFLKPLFTPPLYTAIIITVEILTKFPDGTQIPWEYDKSEGAWIFSEKKCRCKSSRLLCKAPYVGGVLLVLDA